MKRQTYTLITGATGGLGKALAVECARRGMNLILFALPNNNVTALASALMEEFCIVAAGFELDLTDHSALEKTVRYITSQYKIDFVVNNAGIGGTSFIMDTSLEKLDAMIQLNIRSTVFLIRLLIPCLGQLGGGYILNVSSMAAFTPIAYKSVYPASKAFIVSFSLGLREELSSSGISVSVVCPGPIMTNSDSTRRILHQGLKARLSLLSASSLAAVAIEETLRGKVIIVPGVFNKLNHLLLSVLPSWFKLKVVSKQVKKELSLDKPK